MSNQDVTTQPVSTHHNPFGKEISKATSVGAVSIEGERAIAEVQAAYVMAKRFPRSQAVAYDRTIEACKRMGLAEVAQYSYNRGGKPVTGPSIRLAEELARCWGNIQYGMKELSRRQGETEIMAYANDLETGTRSEQVFTVKHIRDAGGAKKDLTDERDIYEIGANMGARRLRERILAVIPPDLVAAAIVQCNETLANGGGDVPMVDRVRAMISKFSTLGINVEMIEKYLGKSTDSILPENLAALAVIYKSIRDKDAVASEFFGGTQADAAPQAGRLASVAERGRKAQEAGAPAEDAPPATDQPGAEDPDVEI